MVFVVYWIRVLLEPVFLGPWIMSEAAQLWYRMSENNLCSTIDAWKELELYPRGNQVQDHSLVQKKPFRKPAYWYCVSSYLFNAQKSIKVSLFSASLYNVRRNKCDLNRKWNDPIQPGLCFYAIRLYIIFKSYLSPSCKKSSLSSAQCRGTCAPVSDSLLERLGSDLWVKHLSTVTVSSHRASQGHTAHLLTLSTPKEQRKNTKT